jgi:hypothetical protein
MSQPAPRSTLFLLVASCCVAALLLHAVALYHPVLVVDDFQILVRSWTWRIALDNLWVPANEHAMPLGRLSTWALAALAGKASTVPHVLLWQGPLGIVLGMLLLYRFVCRELGHPLYGVAAMALFGVSTVYQQAVFWFSASFSVLSLDFLLLGLLAAQAWRRTGRPWQLLLAATWAALAPAWFAIGILAGPLCCLYLLPAEEKGDAAGGTRLARWLRPVQHVLAALVPVLGSVAFLAVSLPRTAEVILHLPHYEGKTAIEAFHVLPGLVNAGRSIVDNLVLGMFGVSGMPYLVCPLPWVFVLLALLTAGGVWWWRGVRQYRLLLLGLGCILANYVLVYGARSQEGWNYLTANGYGLHTWSRYHLFPQFGLTLFLIGGLPRCEGHRLQLDPAGLLSARQVKFLLGLVAILFVIQAPRGVIGGRFWTVHYPQQQAVLRQIDAMDSRCRQLRIDRETAVQALPVLTVPESGKRENGWLLMRGSPDPRPMDRDEARQLLKE